jgi:hypothetical protein
MDLNKAIRTAGIEETMRNELKDVLDRGYELQLGFFDDSIDKDKTFYFYLHEPGRNHEKSIFGHMRRTQRMTEREIAFAASYYLLGTLEGRGQINMEKVTT